MVKGEGPARGLNREHMAEAAVALMEEVGAERFSVRKLAERLSCDPMAVLYHFGTRDGLQRAMADRLSARLVPVAADRPWADRLCDLAQQYRGIALAFPMTFVLFQRYLNTGRSDFAYIEMVHAALAEAGVPDPDLPALCLAWYASVIGLCMAEVGGLIRPTTREDDRELEALPQDHCPLTRRLQPLYARIVPEDVFHRAIHMLACGVGTATTTRTAS